MGAVDLDALRLELELDLDLDVDVDLPRASFVVTGRAIGRVRKSRLVPDGNLLRVSFIALSVALSVVQK
jgi:hypothetical protein